MGLAASVSESETEQEGKEGMRKGRQGGGSERCVPTLSGDVGRTTN